MFGFTLIKTDRLIALEEQMFELQKNLDRISIPRMYPTYRYIPNSVYNPSIADVVHAILKELNLKYIQNSLLLVKIEGKENGNK